VPRLNSLLAASPSHSHVLVRLFVCGAFKGPSLFNRIILIARRERLKPTEDIELAPELTQGHSVSKARDVHIREYGPIKFAHGGEWTGSALVMPIKTIGPKLIDTSSMSSVGFSRSRVAG